MNKQYIKFLTSTLSVRALLTAGLTVLGGVAANAGPFVGAIPPYPTFPAVHTPAPVVKHPGKEYSEEFDRNAAGFLDSSQNVRFDGRPPPGSGIVDTFDYNDPGGPTGGGLSDGSTDPTQQVDALANHGDAFYNNVVANGTAILFSTRVGANVQGAGFDAGAPGCALNPICYETIGGAIGTWATPLQVTQEAGLPAPDDTTGTITIMRNLDGLEVWGPDDTDDADRYSLFDDIVTGVSIYNLDKSAFLTQAFLAGALGAFDSRFQFFLNLIDLDALMVLEDGDGIFETGESILFSLWPLLGAAGFADIGDAAYVMDGSGAITYLDHGGHLWDNDWLGLNVDALEAAAGIPEPASLTLLGAGLLGLGAIVRRRRAG